MRMMMRSAHAGLCTVLGALAFAGAAAAQQGPAGDAAAMADKLNNPISDMISVPLQMNYDFNIGPLNGTRLQLNVQPVIPVSISPNWNMISRTIVPIIYQQETLPPGEGGAQFGMGDITQSFFFSPKSGDVIWGLGPAFLFPFGSGQELSSEKWGVGPTAIVLRQSQGSTFGMLANHIWSFAGDDGRDDVSATFLQPFFAHTNASAFTYGANLEATYDWEHESWAVPLNLNVSKVIKLGGQHMSLGATARYWVDPSDNGPEGLAVRFTTTFIIPTS
jgi:hypothetical protein